MVQFGSDPATSESFKVVNTSVGPQGPTGATGATGPTGSTGATGATGTGFGFTASAATGVGAGSTSASFIALTTPAAVSLTTNTEVTVTVTGNLQNAAAGGVSYLGFAISGASSVPATTAQAIWYLAPSANEQAQYSGSFYVSGLTAGTNTFALQYRGEASATAAIINAQIQVENRN